MTSSVLHRNAGLTLLDERFDRIYEEYADSDDEEEDFDDDDSEQQGDGNSADEELRRNTEFNRFEDVLDDFLYNTDLKGKHMVHRSGDTLYDVDEIRSALRDLAVDPKRYEQDAANNANDKDGDGDDLVAPEAKQRSEWDCETILSTYTNLENRPKVIRDARQTRQRIALSHKTGLPLGILKPRVADIAAAKIATEQVLDSGSVCNSGRNLGQVRSKEETADEKKQRKAAIKEQKRVSGMYVLL
jgi:protein LTV1